MFRLCPGCRIRARMATENLCYPCIAELSDGFAELLAQAGPSSGMDAPDDEAA